MNGQDHTKEPWMFLKENKLEGWAGTPINTNSCYTLNSRGWAQFGLLAGGVRGKANAKRIVECVNECAGVLDVAYSMDCLRSELGSLKHNHDLMVKAIREGEQKVSTGISNTIYEDSRRIDFLIGLFPTPTPEKEEGES